MRKFSDVHGTPSQRYYNVLCLAYGADPVLFGDFVASGKLPKDRAEGCEFEYQQVANAFERLVVPNLDPELRKELHKTWLPPVRYPAGPALRQDRMAKVAAGRIERLGAVVNLREGECALNAQPLPLRERARYSQVRDG